MANPNPTPNPGNLRPFAPGQSGNPAGHSRARRVTAALMALIDERGGERKLAEMWLDAAEAGDFKFFKELLDRVEGKLAPGGGGDEADATEAPPRITFPHARPRADDPGPGAAGDGA